MSEMFDNSKIKFSKIAKFQFFLKDQAAATTDPLSKYALFFKEVATRVPKVGHHILNGDAGLCLEQPLIT